MEKNNFETLLRNKVLMAESMQNLSSDKEKVWKTVQKKPRYRLYYAAAAILFLLILISALYVKQDKTTTTLAKVKPILKPRVKERAEPQVLQESAIIKQSVALDRSDKAIIAVKIKKDENLQQKTAVNTPIEPLPVVERQKGIEPASTITVNNVENKPKPIIAQTTVPEFTVEFKRGKPIDDVELQTKSAIARLKKFKLSKDTGVLATSNEKQKSIFKIKF